MKNFIRKFADAVQTVFGYGIMICLFAGGFTFFGYLVAICIGGETASVIIYGEKALSVTTTLQLDVTFALARAYMSKDSNESKLKALSYNNKCIELIDDDTENACDIYLCRAENYIILNQFEKAFEEIDSTIIQFGHCAKQYFLKARCYFEKYNYDKLDDKSLLQEAEKFAKISVEYGL